MAKINNWQKRRSALNHDWLKNQFMPAFAKFINVIDGRVIDPGFLPLFLASLCADWESHRRELAALIQSFEDAMSPKNFFDQPPLKVCTGFTNWLPQLTHELWATRQSARESTAGAREHLESADQAYSEVRLYLERTGPTVTISDLIPGRPHFVEFRFRCQVLGNSLSKFPSEITAV